MSVLIRLKKLLLSSTKKKIISTTVVASFIVGTLLFSVGSFSSNQAVSENTDPSLKDMLQAKDAEPNEKPDEKQEGKVTKNSDVLGDSSKKSTVQTEAEKPVENGTSEESHNPEPKRQVASGNSNDTTKQPKSCSDKNLEQIRDLTARISNLENQIVGRLNLGLSDSVKKLEEELLRLKNSTSC